jgi:hypothetical protein
MSIGGYFAEMVQSGALLIAAPLAMTAGLGSFISPCILPLVPVHLGGWPTRPGSTTGAKPARMATQAKAGDNKNYIAGDGPCEHPQQHNARRSPNRPGI